MDSIETTNAFKKFLKAAHEPLGLIDATPNEQYPLRILKAYRESCDYRWGDGLDGGDLATHKLKELNNLCDERAKILDAAIYILEREMI